MLSERLIKVVIPTIFEDAMRYQTKGKITFAVSSNTILLGNKEHGHWADDMNIYEFANRCKVWAHKQGIKSFLSGIDDGYKVPIYFVYVEDFKDADGNVRQFIADNEPDAIFKACEFILNIVENIKG